MFQFSFCPGMQVPVTLPPEPIRTTSLNGWDFSAKPSVPYRRKFKVKMYGLTWYLQPNGLYDITTNQNFNAHRLELFYRDHQTFQPFVWTHSHIGNLVVSFDVPLQVPEAEPNSGGLIEMLEVQFIEHSPSFS